MRNLRLLAALTCLFALVTSAAGINAQCGGYCQTQGSCPATGRGCDPNVCCYCCFQCTDPAYQTSDGNCGYDSQHQIIHYVIYTQVNYYNCYSGANCTYDHSSSEVVGPSGACERCPNEV